MAHNMVSQSDHETRSKESGTIRTLLKHCLDMLNPEKFPEYHCAAAYMMSDLYIDDNVSEQSWTSDGSDVQDPDSLNDDVSEGVGLIILMIYFSSNSSMLMRCMQK